MSRIIDQDLEFYTSLKEHAQHCLYDCKPADEKYWKAVLEVHHEIFLALNKLKDLYDTNK